MQNAERKLICILANIKDLLKGFMKNTKDLKLFSLKHQKKRLQPLDFESQ